jgi:hypothetical protein
MVSKLSRRSLRKIAGDHPSHAGVSCGDFNWMKYVTLPPGAGYIGGDIVIPFYPRFKKYGYCGHSSTGQINASMPNRRI